MAIHTICSEVIGILKKATEDAPEKLHAAYFADKCGINASTICSFLKGDKLPRKIEKVGPYIPDLIHELVDAANKDEFELVRKRGLGELIGVLNNYPLHQAKYGEADPGKVIPWRHPAFVETTRGLSSDERTPFLAGYRTGPKTGKSTLGRAHWAQLVLGGDLTKDHPAKRRVVYLDCKDMPKDLALQFPQWMEHEASRQMRKQFAHPPSDWDTPADNVYTWLSRDVLCDAECVFVIDHLESLAETKGAWARLSTGWHRVINSQATNPELYRLGLIFIYDGACRAILDEKQESSRMEQAMADYTSHLFFSQGAARKLINHVVGTSLKEVSGDVIARSAWEKFAGHPYLTHVFAEGYASSKPASALEDATKAAEAAFATHIVPRLMGNVYGDHLIDVATTVFAKSECTLCPFQTTDTFSLLLQDSGLFREVSLHTLKCTTLWVQQQLASNFIDS